MIVDGATARQMLSSWGASRRCSRRQGLRWIDHLSQLTTEHVFPSTLSVICIKQQQNTNIWLEINRSSVFSILNIRPQGPFLVEPELCSECRSLFIWQKYNINMSVYTFTQPNLMYPTLIYDLDHLTVSIRNMHHI